MNKEKKNKILNKINTCEESLGDFADSLFNIVFSEDSELHEEQVKCRKLVNELHSSIEKIKLNLKNK